MFTPAESAAGAILLHLAATTLLFDAGAILGASGFLHRLMTNSKHAAHRSSTLWFFGGMAAAVGIITIALPQLLPQYPTSDLSFANMPKTLLSGLLAGWGTKHCGGCTSGHMLCGISRFSPRSILATAIFFSTAAATFHITHPSLETAQCNGNLVMCYQPHYPDGTTLGLIIGVVSLVITFIVTIEMVPPTWTGVNSVYGVAGLAFGLGLLISGMADPSKIQSFFAIRLRPLNFDRWDPSLMLLLVFALLPNIISIRWRGLKGSPRLAMSFSLPTKTMSDVDKRFVLGAVAFGVSWGWTGVCPGPAILRSLLHPVWGCLWMSGFYVGRLDSLG